MSIINNTPAHKLTQDDLFYKLDQLKQEIAFIKQLLQEWLMAEDTDEDALSEPDDLTDEE